jgi:hypothetical protein
MLLNNGKKSYLFIVPNFDCIPAQIRMEKVNFGQL